MLIKRRIYKEIYKKLDEIFGGVDRFLKAWETKNRAEILDPTCQKSNAVELPKPAMPAILYS